MKITFSLTVVVLTVLVVSGILPVSARQDDEEPRSASDETTTTKKRTTTTNRPTSSSRTTSTTTSNSSTPVTSSSTTLTSSSSTTPVTSTSTTSTTQSSTSPATSATTSTSSSAVTSSSSTLSGTSPATSASTSSGTTSTSSTPITSSITTSASTGGTTSATTASTTSATTSTVSTTTSTTTAPTTTETTNTIVATIVSVTMTMLPTETTDSTTRGVVFATRPTILPQPSTPNDVCHQCRDRRNQKDHYADETDCHYYYQCFFYNETFAIGIRQRCPSFTYWHDEVLQCLPEGDVPCLDICRDDAVSAAGCYGVPYSCSQFMICSNSASYPFCCPTWSSFDASSCSCVNDDTCSDVCILPTRPPTTVSAPMQIDATDCVDSFGVTLRAKVGFPGSYFIIDANGVASVEMPCAPGTHFDVSECRCDDFTEVTGVINNQNQCNLFMPFSEDFSDYSVYRHTTFLYGDAGLDNSSLASTRRHRTSFRFNAGRVEVPGLKAFDFGKAASFCLFYRGANGGLLSNNNDSMMVDYSTIIALQNTNLAGYFHFWRPYYEQAVTYENRASAWKQVCIVFDGSSLNLYFNSRLVDVQPVTGSLSIHHCPYTIGSDQTFGDFVGNIDSLLICPFAFQQTDVDAHFDKDYNYFSSNGYIPSYP